MAVQEVLERGDPGTLGGGGLGRLRELLRVAEQHERARRRAERHRARQRELRRFVADEDVHGAPQLRAGPQPGRPADEHSSPTGQRRGDLPMPGRPAHVPRAAVLLGGAPLQRGAAGRGEQLADDRMRLVADPNGAPVVEQRADELRADRGLAGPGRALDGEHLPVQVACQAHHSVPGGLPRGVQRPGRDVAAAQHTGQRLAPARISSALAASEACSTPVSIGPGGPRPRTGGGGSVPVSLSTRRPATGSSSLTVATRRAVSTSSAASPTASLVTWGGNS